MSYSGGGSSVLVSMTWAWLMVDFDSPGGGEAIALVFMYGRGKNAARFCTALDAAPKPIPIPDEVGALGITMASFLGLKFPV